MKHILIFLIKIYKTLISPLFGSACRFHPSCSDYASQAINEGGIVAGVKMAVKRILKCQPFSAGGYDPVSL